MSNPQENDTSFKINPPHHNQNKNGATKSSWKLISQGAEARVWHVPNFLSSSITLDAAQDTASKSTTTTLPAICKERFPKKYRHSTLDKTILKSRTKSEVKCLVRCRRGGVPCPAILACDMGPKTSPNQNPNGTSSETDTSYAPNTTSMCLFLEFIPGITVREFLDQTMSDNRTNSCRTTHSSANDSATTSVSSTEIDINERSPPQKKFKNQINEEENKQNTFMNNVQGINTSNKDTEPTKNDTILIQVAYAIGEVVAKMHNVNVVHGDLTTSNIMIRNPTTVTTSYPSWKPNLVLIDFGLAGTAGAKGVSHEEKAVDLYVLERALDSTHPACSQWLQKEIFRAYKKHCSASDSVLQRLSQVRLRGRKRECFG